MPITASGRLLRSPPPRVRAAKRGAAKPPPRPLKPYPGKPILRRKTIAGSFGKSAFEFDIATNLIRVGGRSIALEPLETHVLRILLNNRGQLTTTRSLARARLGAGAVPTAAAVHDAVASLRRKLAGTGLEIKINQRIGFEIHAFKLPELNRRLSDKILLAMNQALESGNRSIVEQLHVAWDLAKESERQWLKGRKTREKRALPKGK